MIDTTGQYIIDLLGKSIIPDADMPSIPGNANIQSIANIIINNGILLTVFPTLSQDTSTQAKELQNKLSKLYYPSLKQTIMQNNEGISIQAALSNEGLDLIALKGWELRKLYPEDTRRSMADLDILVRNYNFKIISEVMNKLGYKSGSESPWKHDSFTKDIVTVEMHKRLTDDSKYVQAWEQRMWDNSTASKDNKHIFLMSDEDYYIFHFLHLQKDTLNGSLGLRRVADTWLYKNAHKAMNSEYLDKEFKNMGLTQFVKRLEKFADDCFTNKEFDENSLIMLNHALYAGIYGNGKSYKAGRIARMSDDSVNKGKVRSFLSAVFLPIDRMKAHFPNLSKYPILLPYYWVVRIIRLSKNGRKFKNKLDYSDISQADYAEMKQFFSACGLD